MHASAVASPLFTVTDDLLGRIRSHFETDCVPSQISEELASAARPPNRFCSSPKIVRVHGVYIRPAISGFCAIRAPRIFNNLRVFNRPTQFDSPHLHQLKVSVIRRLRPILVRPCSKYFSIASHYWRRGNWNNLHYLFTSASLLISANALAVGVKYANFSAGDPSSTHEINEMSSTVAETDIPTSAAREDTKSLRCLF